MSSSLEEVLLFFSHLLLFTLFQGAEDVSERTELLIASARLTVFRWARGLRVRQMEWTREHAREQEERRDWQERQVLLSTRRASGCVARKAAFEVKESVNKAKLSQNWASA